MQDHMEGKSGYWKIHWRLAPLLHIGTHCAIPPPPSLFCFVGYIKLEQNYIKYFLMYFCPALAKLALDLHVKKSLFVCLFVCLSVCLSGLFFKASNWMIYWLLTVVLAPYLSD